jgi:hypothetical protein
MRKPKPSPAIISAIALSVSLNKLSPGALARIEQLLEAQVNYAAVQVAADSRLAEARQQRDNAMRCVAGLGLSHRRIGELTGLSHTRVNQILGTGMEQS